MSIFCIFQIGSVVAVDFIIAPAIAKATDIKRSGFKLYTELYLVMMWRVLFYR